jgi:hypothetical protein
VAESWKAVRTALWICLAVQPPEPDFAASLEDLVDGEVAFEDEVPAVFDLGDGVETRQVHLCPFFLGELRAEDESPVIEPLADEDGAEPIGGGLKGRQVVHRQESVVALVDAVGAALLHAAFCVKFPRPPVLRSCLDNSIISPAAGGIKTSDMFG